MVLTLFISEDKRDEFAGTAWPFDSLLEHTNQGASVQMWGYQAQWLTFPSWTGLGIPACLLPLHDRRVSLAQPSPRSQLWGCCPGASPWAWAGLASPGLLHGQVETAVLDSLMWAWGASALTAGLLLHLGRGEPGRGGLLPASCRGGAGRKMGSEWLGLYEHQLPLGERGGWVGRGPPGRPGCWSAILPTDVIACDAYPCVAILQVIIIAKLCQSCPGSGPPGGEGREAGDGAGAGAGGPSFSPPTVTVDLWGCRLSFY